MSLASFALRLCAVKAITGRTLAEGRVSDSQIVPDAASLKGAAPFVIVSTDDTRCIAERRSNPREFNAPRTVDLAIDIVLASFVTVPGTDDDGGGFEMKLPQTDESMELTLDLIERQVFRALSDSETEWSRLFLSFAPSFGTVTTKRGAGAENGTRFAARMITVPVDTLMDPDFGAPPPDGAWADLVAAMRSDPGLEQISGVIVKAIVGDELPTWKVVRASSSYAPDEAAGIGLAPDPDLDGVETAVTTIGVNDGDGNEQLVITGG